MTFTPAARDLIQRLEGCRLQAYQDQAGVWTIGYGHTGNVHAGDVWTQDQADAQLGADLARFISGVANFVSPTELTDNQFSALVIFAFNVGLVAFAGSTALRNVRALQLDHVISAMAMWNKITDRSGVLIVNAGLVTRRAAEAILWNTQPKGIDA